jgi:DNA modification methylase
MLTLYHGDCLEVMKDLSANSVDLIICDLPYGCLEPKGRSEESRKKYNRGNIVGANSGCSWDIKIDLEAFWKEVRRIRKSDHTPTIHFCTTKFGYELIQSNPNEFRYDLVWDKQRGVSFLSANKMPMRSHEMIYVFSKSGAFYKRVDISGNFPKGGGGGRKNALVYGTTGKPHITEAGRRCVLSVVHSDNDAKTSGKHPTEKPIDLYKWLIERYCPVGGTVLDPTFGSGNSVFTAYALGRNAIGIEKDEKFYKKAEARLEAV